MKMTKAELELLLQYYPDAEHQFSDEVFDSLDEKGLLQLSKSDIYEISPLGMETVRKILESE